MASTTNLKTKCYRKICENIGATKFCSKCMKVAYCSKECQKLDWKNHKRGCGLKLSDITGFNDLWTESCKNIDAGRYSVCIPQSKEILERVLDAGLDPYDPQLSKIYHRLGHVYMGSGDYKSAEINFKLCVDIASPDDVEALRGLIVFYLNIHKFSEAEPLCFKYLKQNQIKYGESDVRCAQPLRFLGVLLHRQKKYEEAIQYLEDAYSLWSTTFGPVHMDVQRVTNDLVEALKDSKQYERAEQFAEQNYENAVTFAIEPNHLTISDSAWSMARVFVDQQKHLDRAESLCLRALEIRELVLGKEATRVAEVLVTLVQIHLITGMYSDTDIELISRAYTNFVRTWGESHDDAIDGLLVKDDLERKLEDRRNASPSA